MQGAQTPPWEQHTAAHPATLLLRSSLPGKFKSLDASLCHPSSEGRDRGQTESQACSSDFRLMFSQKVTPLSSILTQVWEDKAGSSFWPGSQPCLLHASPPPEPGRGFIAIAYPHHGNGDLTCFLPFSDGSVPCSSVGAHSPSVSPHWVQDTVENTPGPAPMCPATPVLVSSHTSPKMPGSLLHPSFCGHPSFSTWQVLSPVKSQLLAASLTEAESSRGTQDWPQCPVVHWLPCCPAPQALCTGLYSSGFCLHLALPVQR